MAPGTVASARAAAGVRSELDPDNEDHWHHARIEAPFSGKLVFEGLATLCEIWIGDDKRCESRSMFLPVELDVALDKPTDIFLCFRALAPRLAEAPRRSRWRPVMIQPNALRWFRTTALGSMPGWAPPGRPVGPWRPVTRIACAAGALSIKRADIRTSYDGANGRVSARIELERGATPRRATLICGDVGATLESGANGSLQGSLAISNAMPWFPHTHGDPHLYPLALKLDDVTIDLGRTGFREITVDRDVDGEGFGLIVNGAPIFCRGASWSSADVTSLAGDRASYEPWLKLARDAGMNMIRVSGVTTYESNAFFELCDELGLMIWQDMMLANFDYPQSDKAFTASVEAEAEALLDRTQTSPSLAILCGGSEVFQQAAMLGAPREAWSGPLFDNVLPSVAARLRPDLIYVPNSPSGGALPFVAESGVIHYYGVGAYRRDFDDARRARVRFASECLAFANPPEEISLARAGVPAISHHPLWKERVPRDVGAPWDFDDVRDHYLERVYGVSALALRRDDPERYFELSRAVIPVVMETVFAEWRRPASPTRGGLVWMLQDMRAGAGWGVIASDGEPKSAWHGLKRAFQPVQIGLTDEGVNGLHLHVINERPQSLDAAIELVCLRDGAVPVKKAARRIQLHAREGTTLRAFDLFGEFFDISYAYRFGPPAHDATVATLRDVASGATLAEAFHYPAGRSNARRETGLSAELIADGDEFALIIRCARLAQSVHIDDDNFRPRENWFDLAPGVEKCVALQRRGDGAPSGVVRAVNALEEARYGI